MAGEDEKSIKTVASTATQQTVKKPPPPPPEAAPVVKVEEEISCKKYIWNSDTGEFLGRNCMSWLLIFIFYVIFFGALACFFIMCWYISLSFLDPNAPYRNGDAALLYSRGPGLSARPVPDRAENGLSTLLWIEGGPYDAWKFWSDQLDDWFTNIPSKNVRNKVCLTKVDIGTGKSLLKQDKGKNTVGDTSPCFVDPKWYGPCSKDKDKTFGYDRAEPCILYKLNRIYDWKPAPFSYKDWEGTLKTHSLKTTDDESVSVPYALTNYIVDLGKNNKEAQEMISTSIWVWCDGENDHDKETLGSIQYYPGPYIPAVFFPFKSQKGYQTPFLMLQLKRPVPGTMISIVCKAYAKNINQDRETGVGIARFQVMTG